MYVSESAGLRGFWQQCRACSRSLVPCFKGVVLGVLAGFHPSPTCRLDSGRHLSGETLVHPDKCLPRISASLGGTRLDIPSGRCDTTATLLETHMRFTSYLAGLTLVALCPLGAHATTSPTFDFYGEGPLLDQTSRLPLFKSGSLSLEVSAKTNSGVANVVLSNTGLGVEGGLLGNDIEGETGDTLTLSFSQTVRLTGIQLSYWDRDFLFTGDRATLSWGGRTITLGEGSYAGTNDILYTTIGLSDVVGQTFTLKASGKSDFRLAGLFVTPAVPEPGAWATMALGLVGVAAVAGRRRRAD